MKEGKKAPGFKLKDKDGEWVSLREVENKFVVVYFYPKDDTPGCTIEANEFTSLLGEFGELDVKVIGISGGDEKSKKKFCERHDIRITLLSDPDFSVSRKYDAYGEKHFMGRKFDGIFRVTYVLDSDKNIIKTYGKVKAAGHAAEVLRFIRVLKSG